MEELLDVEKREKIFQLLEAANTIGEITEVENGPELDPELKQEKKSQEINLEYTIGTEIVNPIEQPYAKNKPPTPVEIAYKTTEDALRKLGGESITGKSDMSEAQLKQEFVPADTVEECANVKVHSRIPDEPLFLKYTFPDEMDFAKVLLRADGYVNQIEEAAHEPAGAQFYHKINDQLSETFTDSQTFELMEDRNVYKENIWVQVDHSEEHTKEGKVARLWECRDAIYSSVQEAAESFDVELEY